MLPNPRIFPQAEEIGLKMITTAKISNNFSGVPVHIKHVLAGVPKISKTFSLELTESPSLRRSIRKTDTSGDANI